MATKKQKEELIAVLKFTPRTYKIRLWGYGGEYVMGTVDRKIYDYFRRRRLDLSEYAWDSDYADANNIPEDMQPFYPGQWHDCEDMGHCWGVDRNAGTLQVEDEHGNVVYEKSLDDISGMGVDEENPEASEPEWHGGDEVWIDMKDPGTVVFIGTSSEKGTFFEGDLELKTPFNPGRIALKYDEIDGNEIINGVSYDGEDVDNWGGDTSGKGTDHAFYIAGSNKQDGKGYERYRNMDDIDYTMTEWFPKKVKPELEGHYEVKDRDGYTYRANWTGTRWEQTWGEPPKEIKIKEWRGIAYDPDEQHLRDELDRIALTVPGFPTAAQIDELEQVECVQCDWRGSVDETNDWDGQMACPECGEPVEFIDKDEPEETQSGWPFGPAETKENNMTTESKSKWWTVKTYHKKNCEQQEYFIQREGDGRIKVTDGFRWCTYNVETNDGEFPKFEFTTVPGGNAAKDSLDMNNLYGSNIESSELVSMDDGGCWGGWEIEGVSEEEEEKLNEFLEENGAWALEDEGEWYLDETEVWVWGPLEVSDDEGNVRIVIADENGNMVDFKDE